eukprot:4251360-Prymnesium_polylepis.1
MCVRARRTELRPICGAFDPLSDCTSSLPPVWMQELEEKAEEIHQLKKKVKEQQRQIIKLGVKVEELEAQRELLVKERDNAFEN